MPAVAVDSDVAREAAGDEDGVVGDSSALNAVITREDRLATPPTAGLGDVSFALEHADGGNDGEAADRNAVRACTLVRTTRQDANKPRVVAAHRHHRPRR